ncbi:MAG TPA: ABC transporter ATP-binding protein [Mycobacteriales bacterium]|jgi:ABC-type multidrug transport system ATPase subunit|nr:ABC transporter ATP-binding protein [Mycobacteriales bacterium]
MRTVPEVSVSSDPMPRPDDAIVVDGLTVRYGARAAVDGVSLRVGRGEVVGLLGPNGAGKTTTVDVCCGLRVPDAGTVTVLGLDARTAGAELRRRIGVVPQESGLYDELTAVEHLRLFAALYNLKRPAARIGEVLDLLGLAERRTGRVGTFSGGMKRRLALARALLHDPPVLFLDEPTLGVDVHGRRALWDHVNALKDEGRSVLLTTNYLEEATALCDRVVIVDRGRVLADERPEILRRQSGTTLLLSVDARAAEAAAAVTRDTGAPASAADARTVRVALPGDEVAAPAVAAASRVATVTGIRTDEPSLEEVFLRLTGQRA